MTTCIEFVSGATNQNYFSKMVWWSIKLFKFLMNKRIKTISSNTTFPKNTMIATQQRYWAKKKWEPEKNSLADAFTPLLCFGKLLDTACGKQAAFFIGCWRTTKSRKADRQKMCPEMIRIKKMKSNKWSHNDFIKRDTMQSEY